MSKDRQCFLEWKNRLDACNSNENLANLREDSDDGVASALVQATQASQYGLLANLRILYPVESLSEVRSIG